MKNLLIALLLLIVSGCTTYEYGTKVVQESQFSQAKVKFQSHDYLTEDAKKRSSVEMWTEEKLKTELEVLPLGGYLIVTVFAHTIEAANTKYWNFIIKDSSETEIYRRKGSDDIADHSYSQYGPSWYNIEVIRVPLKMTEPFKVYVIDELNSERYEFTVYPS